MSSGSSMMLPANMIEAAVCASVMTGINKYYFMLDNNGLIFGFATSFGSELLSDTVTQFISDKAMSKMDPKAKLTYDTYVPALMSGGLYVAAQKALGQPGGQSYLKLFLTQVAASAIASYAAAPIQAAISK